MDIFNFIFDIYYNKLSKNKERPVTVFHRVDLSKLVSESKKSFMYFFPLKGGDPAADSSTATLLRLHPSYRPYLRRLPL